MNSRSLDNVHLKRKLFVACIITLVTVLCSKSKFESLNLISILIPIVFLLFYKRSKKLRWNEVGFRITDTFTDVKENIVLIIIVSIAMQIAAVLIGKFIFPEYLTHVIERLPFSMESSYIAEIITTLIYGTFLEEVIYRCFVQGVFSKYIHPFAAIIISSVMFALVHLSAVNSLVAVIDGIFIFLDSIIYGLIYYKSENIFASWIAHFFADLFSLIVLFIYFQ